MLPKIILIIILGILILFILFFNPPLQTMKLLEWKTYENTKYKYTLNYPADWQLSEETIVKLDNNIDVKLSSKDKTGSILLTAVPVGHGCFFMQGPNPNLMPRIFKIGDKSTTVKDDCFGQTYGINLKNKTGDEIWLETVARDNDTYKIIYKILNSLQGLELAE